MITRRDLLRAAAIEGLAVPAALAQVSPRRLKRRTKTRPVRGTSAPAASVPSAVKADDRVNKVLAPVRDEHHLPGLIGAILTGNRLAAIGAVGIRKIGSDEPILVTDKVHLGSCTKAMTATIIGMLVEEKKLSWGSTIREVFPGHLANVHPAYQSVTLSHLLTHRAGLPPNVPWWDLPGQTPTFQRLAIVDHFLSKPPRHKPGSKYEYSNVGYALAGLMAEVVTDRAWEELMRERLFEPLKMESAGFGQPGHARAVDQPWGHFDVKGEIRPTQIDNAPSLGPAGIVHCSIPDWARFAALHMAAERGKPRLLKGSTFRTLHTPPPGFEYAAGWIVVQRTWAGGLALNHAGSNTVWYSVVWLAPAINTAFLVSTNQGGKVAEKATDDAVIALIRASQFLLRR